MLSSLDIRDILIIERLELEFQPGLNVLTGETGAGKSILLDSIGFVLGWRGRADLVRSGAAQGEVTAVFDLPETHAASAVLAEAQIPFDGELILRRVNRRDGRKTAWVNDRRVSGEVLRALSETLVELHGQFDDRGLLNPRGHMALLDEFANISNDLTSIRKQWRAVAAARKVLAKAESELAAVKAEEEFLRHAVAELDELDPQPQEEAALDAARRAMQGAERIREDISKAAAAVGYGGAEGLVNDASRWLEAAAEQAEGQLAGPIDALIRAQDVLSDALQGIEAALATLSFNPSDLEQSEERLFAIRALARKHEVQPDDLGAFADSLRAKITALDQGAGDVAELRSALCKQELLYADKAAKLTAKRRKSARGLDKAMARELAPLKMERAIFTTEVTSAEAGPDGQDAVVFTVTTNPGAPSGPLNKIASGGELSRFLLALKVCLMRDTTGVTMIFDEIDRGVGGATADAVGRRLVQLAAGAQVLVVTHSPQVAALGAHHWRGGKYVRKGQTISAVVPLDAGQRIDEIARMLSGDTVTDVAREAAKSLLHPKG
ncbi:DNA recombination protein RecN [Marinosulfonomonas sp. PRT-SC04]|nr:DNA recombination protein RecN [Marinosulfonomonas sp. PRT-SC04]